MIYFIILSILAALTIGEYLVPEFRKSVGGEVSRNYTNRYKKILYYVIIATLIIFAGIRYYSGFDYINYIRIFKRSTDGIRYLNVEYGYYWLNRLISKFTDNAQIIIFLMAFMTLIIKGIVIKKNTKSIFFAIYIYFCMYFLVYDMGQIRSSFAQALTFLAIYLYIEGKAKTAIALIILGSFFHSSCLVVLLIFILRDKWISDKIASIIFIISIILGQILDLKHVGMIAQNIHGTLGNKIYEYTVSDKFASKIGLSFNVIFDIVILLFIMYMRKKYKLKSKRFNILFNFYLIGTSIYLLFNNYFTIGVRLSDYFRLSLLILIPMLLDLIENKTIKYIILFIFILIFGLMVYRQLDANSMYYFPYSINLFNNAKVSNII